MILSIALRKEQRLAGAPFRQGILSALDPTLLSPAGDESPAPTFVPGVEHVWDEGEVRLNACVIHFYNKKSGRSITSY
jgi:hypothetical protein